MAESYKAKVVFEFVSGEDPKALIAKLGTMLRDQVDDPEAKFTYTVKEEN